MCILSSVVYFYDALFLPRNVYLGIKRENKESTYFAEKTEIPHFVNRVLAYVHYILHTVL